MTTVQVELRHSGLFHNKTTYVGLCPFHAEKTPSFHIQQGSYLCFGCGKEGVVDDQDVFQVEYP
jgi:DNA primase